MKIQKVGVSKKRSKERETEVANSKSSWKNDVTGRRFRQNDWRVWDGLWIFWVIKEVGKKNPQNHTILMSSRSFAGVYLVTKMIGTSLNIRLFVGFISTNLQGLNLAITQCWELITITIFATRMNDVFRKSPQGSNPFGRYITSMIWVLMLETGGAAWLWGISCVDSVVVLAQISNRTRLRGNTGK